MTESDLATLILNMLITMCRYFPSRTEDGAVIRPLPRIKNLLSTPLSLPHIVQLLLTFDPILVEKVRKYSISILHKYMRYMQVSVFLCSLSVFTKTHISCFSVTGGNSSSRDYTRQSSSVHYLYNRSLLLHSYVHGIQCVAHWTLSSHVSHATGFQS